MNKAKPRTSGLTGIELGVVAAAAALLLCCVVDPFRLLGNKEAARRFRCKHNLQQVAIALHNYHDVYGCFPPAYIADERGRPMHSWRVLILPYMDQAPLYNLYRFDEPWDGPNNSRLAGEVPYVFRCPTGAGREEGDEEWTSYVAIVGATTAFPNDGPAAISEFTDGTSTTLLVVEVVSSGIHWMEPRDLHVTQMAGTINAATGQGIGSAHEGGAHAAFGDGSVRFLSEQIAAEELRRLRERNDGEKLVGEY